MTKTRYINEMTGEPYPDSKGESPVEDEAIVDINEKINDILIVLASINETSQKDRFYILWLLILICIAITIILFIMIFRI